MKAIKLILILLVLTITGCLTTTEEALTSQKDNIRGYVQSRAYYGVEFLCVEKTQYYARFLVYYPEKSGTQPKDTFSIPIINDGDNKIKVGATYLLIDSRYNDF